MMRDIHLSIVSHGQSQLVNYLLADLNELECKDRFQVTLTLNIPEKTPIILKSLSFPIELIENTSIQGFGDNHNKAFHKPPLKSDRQFFFVINPDVRIEHDIFTILVSKMKSDDTIGTIAPIVKNNKGKVEDSARKIPTPWKIIKKFLGYSKNITISESSDFTPDWIAGMFMGFRSEIFKEIQGFNTEYFLYYEDVDICSRLWINDLKVVVVPSVSIIHNAQRDSHKNIMYFKWHIKSMLRFFFSNTYKTVYKIHKKKNRQRY